MGTVFDLGLIVNSNDYRREYTGLHTQFNYRVGDRLNLGGNWTWSHLIGDIVGENATSGTILATLHSQPEYFDRAWSAPVGSLSSDQRHRVRVYGTYDVPIPPGLRCPQHRRHPDVGHRNPLWRSRNGQDEHASHRDEPRIRRDPRLGELLLHGS